MKGDGRDLVPTFLGLPVEGLDVGQHVGDLQVAGRDLASGQAVEHEGVVAVRAVGERDLHRSSIIFQAGPTHQGGGEFDRGPTRGG